MNDIVNQLKALFIKAENERKEAEKLFKASKSRGCFGDCSRLDTLETLTLLCEDLKAILTRLASKQNNIKDTIKSKTIFEPIGSVFNSEFCSIFHDRARAMGVV